MRKVSHCGVIVLLALTLFPPTADAFGRRPSKSEVLQSQIPLNENSQNQNQNDPNGRPPQSVPEPSSILLVGMGLLLMVMFGKSKREGAGTGQ